MIDTNLKVVDIDPQDLMDSMGQYVDESLDKAISFPSEKKAPGAEAPASATVHAWNVDNFGVLFTIRDTDAKGLYVRINNFLKVLKAEGWKPDWKNDAPTAQTTVVGQPTPAEVPNCSIHGTPMQWKSGVAKATGKPYAFFACSQKLATGAWCNGKPLK